MRNGFFGSLTALAAGAGLAFGQPAPLAVAPSGVTPAGFATAGDAMPAAPPVTGTAAPVGGPEAAPLSIAPPMPMPMPGGSGTPAVIPPPLPAGAAYGPPGGPAPYGLPPGPYSGMDAPAPKKEIESCWATFDFLLWKIKSDSSDIPLVTTGALVGQGILGEPTTLSLFPDEGKGGNYDQDTFSGFRFMLGTWFDGNARIGGEAGGFLLERRSKVFAASSDAQGFPILARPAIEAISGQPTSFLISLPTYATGTVLASASSQVYGAEGNIVLNLYRPKPGKGGCTVTVLQGFRYLEIDEKIEVNSISGIQDGAVLFFDGVQVLGPAQLYVNDMFRTRNQFYGAQSGISLSTQCSRFLFNFATKLGYGVNHINYETNGFTSVGGLAPGTPATLRGGLLAQSSNIGRFEDDEFCLLTDVSASVGYQFTQCVTASIGYNFIHLNRVARPGDQIDPFVAANLVPTDPNYGLTSFVDRPGRRFDLNDFWMQGINFTLSMKY